MHYQNALFFTHFNFSIVCIKGFHMKNIFKLSGCWHFHKKTTRFSPNWPTRPIRPIRCSSQNVCLVAEEVYHVPSPCLFFMASHWPSDHMIIWKLQSEWIGPVIFFSCWMDTFKCCKHSESQWSGAIIFFSCWMDTHEGCIIQTPSYSSLKLPL